MLFCIKPQEGKQRQLFKQIIFIYYKRVTLILL